MGVGWGVKGGDWRVEMRWKGRFTTLGLKEKRCRKHRKQKEEEHKPQPSPRRALGY